MKRKKEVWISFKDVVRKAWGNIKDPDYKTIVQRLQDELEGPFFTIPHTLFY